VQDKQPAVGGEGSGAAASAASHKTPPASPLEKSSNSKSRAVTVDVEGPEGAGGAEQEQETGDGAREDKASSSSSRSSCVGALALALVRAHARVSLGQTRCKQDRTEAIDVEGGHGLELNPERVATCRLSLGHTGSLPAGSPPCAVVDAQACKRALSEPRSCMVR
jgi:hypothetical protein